MVVFGVCVYVYIYVHTHTHAHTVSVIIIGKHLHMGASLVLCIFYCVEIYLFLSLLSTLGAFHLVLNVASVRTLPM